MEEKKVTAEELVVLKAISDRNDRCVVELGRIEYQKTLLDQESSKIKNDIIRLIDEEKHFSDQLVTKYGDIKVDLETGIIS
jgi:hypothetical protein